MPFSRRWLLVALSTVALSLGAVILLAPMLPMREGRALATQAASTGDLETRLQTRAQAARRFEQAALSPAWTDEAQRERDALEAATFADLEAHRRSLAQGASGARLHRAWLDELARRPGPVGERAAMARIQALTSYGEFDLAEEAISTMPGPFGQSWLGIGRLWQGRLDELPGELTAAFPAQLLTRQGPADTQAPDEALLALLVAERARRAGRFDDSLRVLAPLLDHDDATLAAAATFTLARTLRDQAQAPAGGLSLVGVAAEADPEALAGLRTRLAASPEDDPRWTAAWLSLAELEAHQGRTEAALEAIWAAIGTSTTSWAPPPETMPAQLRLDVEGALNPELAARPRLIVGEARLAALAAGEDATELAFAEAALLLLQGRGFLALDDLPSARSRFDRAADLVPGSPAITAWRVLAARLADDIPTASAILGGLPDLAGTADDEAVRVHGQSWLSSPPPTRAEAPALSLRQLLRGGADPLTVLAFCSAHLDRGEDLLLALGGPPEDRVSLAQALAQSALEARVARTLGDPTRATLAESRRAALATAALAEPHWALFRLGAFSLTGEPAPPPFDRGSPDPLPPG